MPVKPVFTSKMVETRRILLMGAEIKFNPTGLPDGEQYDSKRDRRKVCIAMQDHSQRSEIESAIKEILEEAGTTPDLMRHFTSPIREAREATGPNQDMRDYLMVNFTAGQCPMLDQGVVGLAEHGLWRGNIVDINLGLSYSYVDGLKGMGGPFCVVVAFALGFIRVGGFPTVLQPLVDFRRALLDQEMAVQPLLDHMQQGH